MSAPIKKCTKDFAKPLSSRGAGVKPTTLYPTRGVIFDMEGATSRSNLGLNVERHCPSGLVRKSGPGKGEILPSSGVGGLSQHDFAPLPYKSDSVVQQRPAVLYRVGGTATWQVERSARNDTGGEAGIYNMGRCEPSQIIRYSVKFTRDVSPRKVNK
jgi:hypothetical protein